MCKVYTGYCGTSEIEHGLCACTVDNPLAKARGLSLRTGAQPMLYLPLVELFISINQTRKKATSGKGLDMPAHLRCKQNTIHGSC